MLRCNSSLRQSVLTANALRLPRPHSRSLHSSDNNNSSDAPPGSSPIVRPGQGGFQRPAGPRDWNTSRSSNINRGPYGAAPQADNRQAQAAQYDRFSFGRSAGTGPSITRPYANQSKNIGDAYSSPIMRSPPVSSQGQSLSSGNTPRSSAIVRPYRENPGGGRSFPPGTRPNDNWARGGSFSDGINRENLDRWAQRTSDRQSPFSRDNRGGSDGGYFERLRNSGGGDRQSRWSDQLDRSDRFSRSDSYNARDDRGEDRPSRSRFTALDESITTRSRVEEKLSRNKAGKEKDRLRSGRIFEEEESGILEEDEQFSAKELKKRKKAEKRAKKEKAPIPVIIPQFISVENLATLLNVRVEKFARQLKEMGFEETNNDHILNAETAGLIAGEFGYEPIVEKDTDVDLKPRPPAEDKSLLPPRPPVVTIMGHVDHGKTTLLDWLRKSSIVDTEHGGITQHIGAFSVKMPSGKVITFLDTPGHAAFLSMRARGANVTDIVILVVAGDDSVKPQTVEAINHAKAAGVPIIVAINKMDKEGVNPDRVKGDLARFGVDVEDHGGDTQTIEVSGKTGMGMEDLEEAIITLSEIQDHRAERDGQVEGWILEATKKKKGQVATVLVTRGTLKVGDILVAGTQWTRVRTLTNEHGEEIDAAPPGTPVEVDGWRGPPEAGSQTLSAETEERAKAAVEYREERQERLKAAVDMEAINASRRAQKAKEEAEAAVRAAAKSSGQNPEHAVLAANRVAAQEEAAGKTQEIPFVVKADVSGSVEAVVESISAIGNNEVCPKIIKSGFGAVTENDIDVAAAAEARIVTFNSPTDPAMLAYARTRKVEVLEHNIIYALTEDMVKILSKYLPPKITYTVTGEAEVIDLFDYRLKGKKTFRVAGCRVKNGALMKRDRVRVIRGKETVFEGNLQSLKIVKKNVEEVKKGAECGVGFEGWEGVQVGDRLQCVEEVREERMLHV